MREAVVLLPYQLQLATGLWLALVVICVVLATALALILLARWQKRTLERRVGLEILNQGNVATRYELRAEAGAGAESSGAWRRVAFAFWAEGQALVERTYEEIDTAAPAAPVSARQAGAAGGGPAERKGPAAGAVAERGLGVLGALAMVLSTVGGLLPLSMRNPVLRISTQLRAAASSGRRAMSVPGQLGQIKANAAATPGLAGYPASAGTAAGQAGGAPRVVTVERAWAETPLVQPGQPLSLDLIVRPLALLAGACAFTVLSRPAGQLDAAPVAGQGYVQIGARSWLRRYGPYLLVLLLAAAILVLVFWSVR